MTESEMSSSKNVSVGEVIRHESFPEVLELLLAQRSLVVLLHGLRIPDAIIDSTYNRVCHEFKVFPRTLLVGENISVDARIAEIKQSLLALKPPIPSGIAYSTASVSDITVSSSSSYSSSTTRDSTKKVNSKRINKNAVSVLVAWMVEHNTDPYPSPLEKSNLASETNLSVHQVTTWLTNFRKRIILPIVNKKKQPRNRLDHLFSFVSKADEDKLLLISEAIRSGNFYKSTRHHMTLKEFQTAYNDNFTPPVAEEEQELSILERIQQSSYISSSSTHTSTFSSSNPCTIDDVDGSDDDIDYNDDDDDYSTSSENFLMLGDLMDVEELDNFEFMKNL